MTHVLRDYCRRDSRRCESLVEEVWNFEAVFSDPALRKIASHGYTKGSLEDSNYTQVVEVDGRVVGFLFGRNDKKPHFRLFVMFRILMCWRLFFFKGDKAKRDALLAALKTHVINRSGLVRRGSSEILLFVVDPAFQGQGLGQQLWAGFRDCCTGAGVDSIYVSTNTSVATTFYQSIGFTHLGDFSSPLHTIAQWSGTPCMYQYKC